MKTQIVTFAQTAQSSFGSPGGGADSNFLVMANAISNCFGFAIRPYLVNGEVGSNPGSGYKWANAVNSALPPGRMPLIANVYFVGGEFEQVLITSERFHYFGGRRVARVDLFLPLYPDGPPSNTAFLSWSSYLATLATSPDDVFLESPRKWQRQVPLYSSQAWVGHPFLKLTSIGPAVYATPNPQNLFGFDDNESPGTGNCVGFFYAFEQYVRYRMVFKTTGTAQDITIWSGSNFGLNEGTLTEGQLSQVEVITAANWKTDVSGAACLVLERDISFAGELVGFTAAGGAGPGGNASTVYVARGFAVYEV